MSKYYNLTIVCRIIICYEPSTTKATYSCLAETTKIDIEQVFEYVFCSFPYCFQKIRKLPALSSKPWLIKLELTSSVSAANSSHTALILSWKESLALWPYFCCNHRYDSPKMIENREVTHEKWNVKIIAHAPRSCKEDQWCDQQMKCVSDFYSGYSPIAGREEKVQLIVFKMNKKI